MQDKKEIVVDKTKGFLLLKKLIKTYLRPYLPKLIVAVIFMAISAGMTALLAKLLEPIINKMVVGADIRGIYMVALGVITVLCSEV